jgi:type III restriction enzyme
MLSEGWDANTVTHILGVRAFGTQLLCEQVVGRGLRRVSYAVNAEGRFDPEYAEVYGVPFSFIPCSGGGTPPSPPPPVVRVRALEERIACEITFPRLEGYRYELPRDELNARFSKDSRKVLSTQDIPTKVELHPIVGETSIHTLEDLKRVRVQEIAFRLAKLVLEKYFLDKDGEPKRWLFPQLLAIAKRWIAECVELKDNTFPQLLMISDHALSAAETIFRCIVQSTGGDKILMPILYPYDTVGSTRHVAFDTAKPVYTADARYCHVSHVVADTDSWEQKTAQALEELAAEGLIRCYVKNQNLGFTIPYTHEGEEHAYLPDFLVLVNAGSAEPLHLILEVTGQKKSDKAAKTATAQSLWIPAVNNHGGFGRWAFQEITDPWNVKKEIRATISKLLPAVTND